MGLYIIEDNVTEFSREDSGTELNQDFVRLININENMFKLFGEKKLRDQRNMSLQSAKSL
jgi:hypothetical protein